MFWESQLFGVIIGFALSAPLAWWLDRRRGMHEKTEAARAVRREAHLQAIVAMNTYTTVINEQALFRLGPMITNNLLRTAEETRTKNAYIAALKRMNEVAILTHTFGAKGVEATVRDLIAAGTRRNEEVLRERPEDPAFDFERLAEALLQLASEVARADTDAQRDELETHVAKGDDGQPTWALYVPGEPDGTSTDP